MIGNHIKHRIIRLTNYVRDVASGHSNYGKWDLYYHDLSHEQLYGDEITYRMAADFLADVDEVEDWGCGSGGFRKFCRAKYIGIDGSNTRYADKIVDLCVYRSKVDGILIRHVLEHNYKWKVVLANALCSFQRKLCIIIFTPFDYKTHTIRYCNEFRVPDISFKKKDLVRHFHGLRWDIEENIKTNSEYGIEHVFRIER
jgi:hypothetical protein